VSVIAGDHGLMGALVYQGFLWLTFSRETPGIGDNCGDTGCVTQLLARGAAMAAAADGSALRINFADAGAPLGLLQRRHDLCGLLQRQPAPGSGPIAP